MNRKYPEYGFDKHKGYGTKLHQEMIRLHGLSIIHRKSFDLEKFLDSSRSLPRTLYGAQNDK